MRMPRIDAGGRGDPYHRSVVCGPRPKHLSTPEHRSCGRDTRLHAVEWGAREDTLRHCTRCTTTTDNDATVEFMTEGRTAMPRVVIERYSVSEERSEDWDVGAMRANLSEQVVAMAPGASLDDGVRRNQAGSPHAAQAETELFACLTPPMPCRHTRHAGHTRRTTARERSSILYPRCACARDWSCAPMGGTMDGRSADALISPTLMPGGIFSCLHSSRCPVSCRCGVTSHSAAPFPGASIP